ILGEFPSVTETFIQQEIDYISEENQIFILALKRGGRFSYDEKEKLNRYNLKYIPSLFSIATIKAHIKFPYKIRLLKKYVSLFKGGRAITFFKEIKYVMSSIHLFLWLKERKIDHIHAHFANAPTSIAMVLSDLASIPYSFTAHANDIYVNFYNLRSKIEKALFVVTCTKYNKIHLEKYLENSVDINKIHVIYHGIDPVFWKYREPVLKLPEPLRIIFIGRLVEKKGLIYLLKAIKTLIDIGINIHCRVIGEGHLADDLNSFCEENHLLGSVSFLGWRSRNEIRSFLLKSDVFILPSIVARDGDRDGIPNVLLEAMSCGIPVISTHVSAIPELIINGVNGVLIPEKDPDRIVEAIDYLVVNPSQRVALIQSARETINNKFDFTKCNSFLRELLK
ncbi:MAG: glycosyltransferase family 4 protein, partial [Tannerellaceae bacterium]|nr:glycosyltransferase family 4 protein [Tannerellaceae bacterium]